MLVSEVIFSYDFEKVLQSKIIEQIIEKEFMNKKTMNLFRIMCGMGGNCFAEYLPEERFKTLIK